MKRKIMRRMTVTLLSISLCVCAFSSVPAQAARDRTANEVKKVWDFSESAQGWVYDDSWAGEGYTGGGSCSWDEEKQMLRASLDYSENVDNGWSQTGVSVTESGGIDYSSYKVLTFDLYYDTAAFTTGQITIKPYSDDVFQEQMMNINQAVTEDMGDGIQKITLSMALEASYAKSQRPDTLLLLFIGNNTDYKGDIWLDNITLSNVKHEKYLVDSTVIPETETLIEAGEKAADINGVPYLYAKEVQLADPDAEDSVVSLYQYLRAVGESDAIIYGHMEDTVLKAGSSELSESDTKDVTGSLSAVVGFDGGDLFSGYAGKYNGRHPGGEQLADTKSGNVRAAALFSNEVIEEGGIVTLSCHMPNFSGAQQTEPEAQVSYERWDYSGADSYNLSGGTMNQILPGGAYHEAFAAYLDMIADYCSQVEGPVLFRPFHENTGSWFWWGKAFCEAETYKSVYKYTVEYLRDEKGIHNVLYLYGPGSEAATLEEYEERYPGDAYVDLVGFDTYDSNPVPDEDGYTFQDTFLGVMDLTNEFAEKHGKLFAVTETGISQGSGGIPETGNLRPEWYMEMLDIMTDSKYNCCYFMLWSNYSRTGSYYTPFVEEVYEDGVFFGHELMDYFIAFYNDERSIFAEDQREVMSSICEGALKKPKVKGWDMTDGYMINPVSNSRMLEATTLTARISGEVSEAEFILSKGTGETELKFPAEIIGHEATASLSLNDLKSLGEEADGKVSLYADGALLQTIPVLFNIAPRPDVPYLVDDFESYAGLAGLLAGSWATNKDAGCTLDISLATENAYDGDYSLKFEYAETQNGWAGCELSKEADWSGCNALQFLVVPDGKNQKTVVQINTESGSYEAYLQEYPEYAEAKTPVLVTMPFSEFVDKNGGGNLTPDTAERIRSIGFWVNAIADSEAIVDGMVSGTLYYDAVRAGITDKKETLFEPVQLAGAENLSEDTGEKQDETVAAKRTATPASIVFAILSGTALAVLVILGIDGIKNKSRREKQK